MHLLKVCTLGVILAVLSCSRGQNISHEQKGDSKGSKNFKLGEETSDSTDQKTGTEEDVKPCSETLAQCMSNPAGSPPGCNTEYCNALHGSRCKLYRHEYTSDEEHHSLQEQQAIELQLANNCVPTAPSGGEADQ